MLTKHCLVNRYVRILNQRKTFIIFTSSYTIKDVISIPMEIQKPNKPIHILRMQTKQIYKIK